MATIKSFTSLEQSKKLAEILPLESADMHYCLEKRDVTTSYEIGTTPFIKAKRFEGKCNIVNVQPAWGLAALLGVLPKIGAEEPMVRKLYYVSKPVERYICQYSLTNMTSEYDNPVDACYEMILKLHELKML